MGITGAGKSTFINYLQNKKMLQMLIGNKKNIKVIDVENPEPNIKIGHN